MHLDVGETIKRAAAIYEAINEKIVESNGAEGGYVLGDSPSPVDCLLFGHVAQALANPHLAKILGNFPALLKWFVGIVQRSKLAEDRTLNDQVNRMNQHDTLPATHKFALKLLELSKRARGGERCEQRGAKQQARGSAPVKYRLCNSSLRPSMDVPSVLYSETLILTRLSLVAGGEVEIADIDTVVATAHAKDMAVRRSLITLHRLRFGEALAADSKVDKPTDATHQNEAMRQVKEANKLDNQMWIGGVGVLATGAYCFIYNDILIDKLNDFESNPSLLPFFSSLFKGFLLYGAHGIKLET